MLNLNCVICDELYVESDKVNVTPCGHMFHYTCLYQWLERSATCPQCRTRTWGSYRIYFNTTNSDVSGIDVASLQAMQRKEDEYHNMETQLKKLQHETMKTTELLNENVQVVDQLRKENRSLKDQIHDMKGVSAILTADNVEADRLIRNEVRPHVLANWICTLKRELRQYATKNAELRNALKKKEIDLRKALEVKRKLMEQESRINSAV